MIGDVLRWALAAVGLVAALIGLLFVTRGTALRRVRGMDADGTTVAPGEPGFAATVGLLTGSLLVPGNRVELALDGDRTFERLWADLRGAARSITVQMYYAQPGRVAGTLGAILAERARRGAGRVPPRRVRRLGAEGRVSGGAAPRACAWWRSARCAS
jgi:hypothetical protein